MKTIISAVLGILAISIPAEAQSTLQQRRRLNPNPTAQRILREYQPTEDEQILAELRRIRMQQRQIQANQDLAIEIARQRRDAEVTRQRNENNQREMERLSRSAYSR